MGILGSILGRRATEPAYRTIDGGHPAPYPDMTDEQLYNYEMTFDVPRKTFDRPPPPSPAQTERQMYDENDMHGRHGRHDTHGRHDLKEEPTLLRDPPPAAPPMQEEKIFDAPRYAARQQQPPVQPSRPPMPRLDFSRPVRLITTKQPVEIITTRARHPVYKVHGYIGDDEVVTVFTLDGRLSENGLPYLENVPQMEKLYLNIYLNQDGISTDRFVVTQHASQDAADADAAASSQKGKGERLTCVEVELNV